MFGFGVRLFTREGRKPSSNKGLEWEYRAPSDFLFTSTFGVLLQTGSTSPLLILRSPLVIVGSGFCIRTLFVLIGYGCSGTQMWSIVPGQTRDDLIKITPPLVGLEPTTFELEVQHASPLRHWGIWDDSFDTRIRFWAVWWERYTPFRLFLKQSNNPTAWANSRWMREWRREVVILHRKVRIGWVLILLLC